MALYQLLSAAEVWLVHVKLAAAAAGVAALSSPAKTSERTRVSRVITRPGRALVELDRDAAPCA